MVEVRIQRANADLETRLAKLTSSAEMERRARALGYRPVQPGELEMSMSLQITYAVK